MSQPMTSKIAATVPGEARSRARADRGFRIALVAVIATAIVGAAWLLGERQDFGSIGEGGINANLVPAVGEPAPELLTFTPDGALVRLSDLRGQPVWLNFWGSWCPPCRAEMPELQAAYETLQPRGVVMLGVSIGEEPSVAVEYASRVGATFPILADPEYLTSLFSEEEYPRIRELVETYQINNFPTHIFIDREGIVRAVVLQPMGYATAMHYGEMILGEAVPVGARVDDTPAR
jgi:peroxiredoxin